MAEIYIYDKNATDFDNMGLVGALEPTSCVHEEEANGLSEVTLEHPFDETGKWATIANEMILCVPVPVRTCPEIADGRIVTSVETWTVKQTATRQQRGAFTKKENGRLKGTFKKGASVTVVRKPADSERWKVKTGKLNGWIASAALDYVETRVLDDDPNAIDAVASAWEVRDQYFRIYKVSQTLDGIVAQARHITYDLIGNVTNYVDNGLDENDELPSVTANDALHGVLDNCLESTGEIEVYTDSANARTGMHYELVNPIFAFLDEEEGIAARFGLELVRDNFDMYFLSKAGMNRGVSIEYGKNLIGLTAEEDIDGIVTRIIPKGIKKTGETLLLTDENGVSVPWVESPRADEYATPHMEVLECSDCEVGQNGKKPIVLNRMREQAMNVFADEERDVKALKLTVDFVNLSKCAGYEDYAALEKCFLYDMVTIRDSSTGFTALAKITRGVWDVLLGQWNELELQTSNYTMRGNWESYFAASLKRLEDELRKEYLLEVDWTNGTVLDSDVISTTATARLMKRGTDVTDDLADEDFSWTMLTAGERTPERIAADESWTQAHAGERSVTIDMDDVPTSAVIGCKVTVIVQGRSIKFHHSATVSFKRDGKDGTVIEYVFKTTEDDAAPEIDTQAVQQDDYTPSGWTDDPTGVSAELPFEWVSLRRKRDGLWGAFSDPALWACYVEGPPGPVGPQGERGPQGVPGPDGTTVYYATRAPGSSDSKSSGDLWYHVNASNNVQGIYKCNGGNSWTLMKYDAGSLVVENIVTGSLVSNVLTASMINALQVTAKELDAGGGTTVGSPGRIRSIAHEVQFSGGNTIVTPAIEMSGSFIPMSDGGSNIGGTNSTIGDNRRFASVYLTGSVHEGSDRAFKRDIEPIGIGELLKRLSPVRFRLKAEPDDLRFGFVAQDVRAAIAGTDYEDATLVSGNDGDMSLAYTELIAPLVEGWQAHERQIAEQERRIAALEARLERLENDGR